MSFLVLPPEINSSRMFSGVGSGPMLSAAAAWDGLSAELGSAAESFSSVTSGLAGESGQAWQGAGSAAMVTAAAPYAGFLRAAAEQASGAAAQAKAVASVFESALAATVHPVVVAANRSDLVSLVMSNLFGQNAPAIAAVESDYEQMWAADVSAMVGYHSGASAVAAQLSLWPAALRGVPGLSGLLGDVRPAGVQAAATSAAALPSINLGLGNIGSFNLGSGNIGNFNLGSGNSSGSLNVGSGNFGGDNLGSGNIGTGNFGSGNIGDFNIGSGNFGSGNLGSGNIGTINFGFGNNGAITKEFISKSN